MHPELLHVWGSFEENTSQTGCEHAHPRELRTLNPSMPVSWAQAGGAARFADTNSRHPVKFELQINQRKCLLQAGPTHAATHL